MENKKDADDDQPGEAKSATLRNTRKLAESPTHGL